MSSLPEIPGYDVREELGSGGMAKVYLAIQQNLDRQVALKIMNSSLGTDATFCKRFMNEGKIIAKVSNHPDIITIYDIGCAGDTYFMAMEYAGSGCLTDALEASIDPDVAVSIIRRVAGALGFAHDHGFVHRDVKPANILFRDDGTPTLTDFGIAKSLSNNTRLTQLGYALGTPDYMSPEQARAEELDGRSDIYSLGVVFYELLTGRRPYAGKDAMTVAMMHINEPVPRLPPRLSEYQPFIERMMAKRPEDRYANTKDLVKALDRLEEKRDKNKPDVDVSAPTIKTRITPEIQTGKQNARTVQDGNTAQGRGARRLPVWVQIAVIVVFSAITGVTINWYIGWKNGGQPLAVTEDVTESVQPDIVPIPLDDDAGIVAEPAVAAVNDERPSLEINDRTRERINMLLDVADAHMSLGRYREPANANAFDAYQLVLEIDPGNQAALEGLAAIRARDPVQ